MTETGAETEAGTGTGSGSDKSEDDLKLVEEVVKVLKSDSPETIGLDRYLIGQNTELTIAKIKLEADLKQLNKKVDMLKEKNKKLLELLKKSEEMFVGAIK